MRRLAALVLVLGLLAAACGDDDTAPTTTTSGTVTPTTTTTTTTPAAPTTTTSTTPAFDGSTAPTEGPTTATGTALLTDVQVATGQVTFTFREGTPGYRIAYVEPPITQDGSGEEVTVAGDAHLGVRFEPASGADLSGAEFQETYTGPERVPGEDPVTEVVRTGDFEAVLNWVIGLDAERAYRVEVDGSMLRVYFST